MGRREDDAGDGDKEHRRDNQTKRHSKEESKDPERRHHSKKKSRDDRDDDDVKKFRRRRDEEDLYVSEDRRRSKKDRKRIDDDDDDDDGEDEDRRKRKSKRYREKDEDDQGGHPRSRRSYRDEEEDDQDDRHHSKKKSKRYRDDDDDDEDDRRQREKKSKDRRHRRDEDAPERSRHRDHKTSRKHKSGSSKQFATATGGASLVSLGEKFGKPPPTLIDPVSDYFEYHKHFWVYLFREEGKFFNDLTSEQSHEAFARFAERFNKGDLEASYYCNNGLPQEAIDECRTTAHVWSFSTNDQEQHRLQILQDGVRKQTEYDAKTTSAPNDEGGATGIEDVPFPAFAASSTAASVGDDTRATAGQASDERGAPPGRRLRDLIRTAEEELIGGRKEGRERQLEAKKELSAKIHGAARDKEEMAGAVELGDDALYGDSASDFQKALARERQRTAQREESKEKRMSELQQKEQEKQKAMLEKLGLTGIQPGQKITIAPRKDN